MIISQISVSTHLLFSLYNYAVNNKHVYNYMLYPLVFGQMEGSEMKVEEGVEGFIIV